MSDPTSSAAVEYSSRTLDSSVRSILQSSVQVRERTSDCVRTARAGKPVPLASTAGMAVPSAGLPTARLKRVLAFIESRLDKNIRLADLGATAGMSVYYFATLFRRSTGFSPRQYVLQRRVFRARELLQNTSRSVLEVSLDTGFQHQNNFARAFRRITGMTPSHFRGCKQPQK